MKSYIPALILFVFIFTGAARAQVYKHPNIDQYKADHKTMAILPFVVTRIDKTKEGKNADLEKIEAENETYGFALQRSLRNYFITKKPKKYDWSVEMQSTEETNLLLSNAGIDYKEIILIPKDSLAAILGVDAILFTEVSTLQTISDGAAVALNVFTGYGGYTGNMNLKVEVYDGASGDMEWQYLRALPSSYWGQHEMLINNLMKKTVNNFPYKNKVGK